MDFLDKEIEIEHEGEILSIETSKFVNIPSPAIHIENKLSLVQKKLWFELVYKAFPMMGKQREHIIKLSELKKLIGWEDTTSNDTELKEALYGLSEVAIQWNIFGKDKKNKGWESFSLLAGCRIPKNSGICIFDFSSFLEERFLSMGDEFYVKIDLVVSNKFQSKYALSIYCLALDYLMLSIGYSEKKFSLEQLRKYLALKDDEYKLMGDFNRRIIEPSEKEINNVSDMVIKIEPYKEGRKITGYKLCMHLKEQKRLELMEKRKKFKEVSDSKDEIEMITKEYEKQEFFKREEIIIKNKDLKSFFSRYNISSRTDMFQDKFQGIQELFSNNMEYIEDYLLYLSKYTEKELEKGSISNVAGFYVSLFKNDIQMTNYFELLGKQQEKEQKLKVRIENIFSTKKREMYEISDSTMFKEYIIGNIEKLESEVVKILSTIPKNNVAYGLALEGGKIPLDKNIFNSVKPARHSFITNELLSYKEELKYKPLSFEEWERKYLTEELKEKMREEIRREQKY